VSQLSTDELTNHLADLMHHETLAVNSKNHKLKSTPLKRFTNLNTESSLSKLTTTNTNKLTHNHTGPWSQTTGHLYTFNQSLAVHAQFAIPAVKAVSFQSLCENQLVTEDVQHRYSAVLSAETHTLTYRSSVHDIVNQQQLKQNH